MAEWQNGGMAEWRKGGMAEWYFTTYLIYPAIFTVHADDARRRRRRRRHRRLLNHLDVQADRGFATDEVSFLSLFILVM